MKSDSLARGVYLSLCLSLFLLSTNSCATADKGNRGAPEEPLKSSMEQCTAKYGYDPDKTQALGERELGQGEEEWRSCVYSGLRKLVVEPTGAVPKLYADLIAQDRKLTDAIKKGEMTRSERKQKNVALIEEIKREEEARRAEQLKKQQRDMDEVMRKKMDMDMRRGFQMHAQDSLLRAMSR